MINKCEDNRKLNANKWIPNLRLRQISRVFAQFCSCCSLRAHSFRSSSTSNVKGPINLFSYWKWFSAIVQKRGTHTYLLLWNKAVHFKKIWNVWACSTHRTVWIINRTFEVTGLQWHGSQKERSQFTPEMCYPKNSHLIFSAVRRQVHESLVFPSNPLAWCV